jgi:hypothetical protein
MTRTALAACLALTFPALAGAATHGAAHKQVRQDQQQLRDDLRDARQAQQLLKDFDRAAASGNRRTLAAAEARVERALGVEAREAKVEAGEAAHRLRDDSLKPGQPGWRPSPDAVDQRRDQLEEAKDRVNDRRDLILEADYRSKIAGIRDEWQSLRGHRERKHMRRKHALLEEVVRLSRLEIRRDVNELHEDREKLEEHHD